MENEFEIKDLGSLKYFLEIEGAKSKKDIFLSQRKYILDLLKEWGMIGCKPCATPIESNRWLKEDDGNGLVDAGRYLHLVGHLIYLSFGIIWKLHIKFAGTWRVV